MYDELQEAEKCVSTLPRSNNGDAQTKSAERQIVEDVIGQERQPRFKDP